jgi:hypothetical protein
MLWGYVAERYDVGDILTGDIYLRAVF